MSGRFFNREYELAISRVTKGTYFTTVDELKITELRVSFDYERTLKSQPNTAKLIVMNMSEESRAFVEQKRVAVKFSAGYDGELAQLITGDVKRARSEVKGVDWQTTIEIGDGHRAHKHARLNKSYGAGTSALQVLKDAAKAMGLSVPTNVAQAKELLSSFVSGTVATGLSSETMTEILKPRGMSWSVQHGKLQVLRDGGALEGEAFIVEVEEGMLGNPSYGAPTGKKGKRELLTVQTLLRPELAPGRKIDLRAKSARGLFRIEKVKAVGDIEDKDWSCTLDARPL